MALNENVWESIHILFDEPLWNLMDVTLTGGELYSFILPPPSCPRESVERPEEDEREEFQYILSILNDISRPNGEAPMVQEFQPKVTIYKNQNGLTLAKTDFRNMTLSTPRRPKWEDRYRHIQLAQQLTRLDEALFSRLFTNFGSLKRKYEVLERQFVTDFGIECKKDVKTTPSLSTNNEDQRQQLRTKRGRAIIRNMVKFDCIDRQLEVDEALSEELRHILLHEMENEADHKRCVWRALNYLMTTKLASKFDWSGKNGKRSFRFTTLRRVLFDAVRVRFPRETDYDLHHPVQKWLQAAVALNQRQHATQDSMVIGGRSRKSLIPQRSGCGSVKNSKVPGPQKRRGQRSNKQKGHCDTCHPIAIL